MRRQLMSATVIVAALLVSTTAPTRVATARAAGPVGTTISTQLGVDTWYVPSVSQMRTIWQQTPYGDWGFYLPGAINMYSPTQPNLTSDWVDQVTRIGWGLMPIWAGPDAPCSPRQGAKFSYDNAFNDGFAQAQQAYSALQALGVGGPQVDTPVTYDLEGFDSPGQPPSRACQDAVNAFISGWVTYLHEAPAQRAGVYGSVGSSYLDNYASVAPSPDFIWGGFYDGDPSPQHMAPFVGSGHWANHARIKQFAGSQDLVLADGTTVLTSSGQPVPVDRDCFDAPVSAGYTTFTNPYPLASQPCR